MEFLPIAFEKRVDGERIGITKVVGELVKLGLREASTQEVYSDVTTRWQRIGNDAFDERVTKGKVVFCASTSA